MIILPILFDFVMNDIHGKAQKLDSFKGKVVLVVNVASFCGYTKQYASLEKLYQKHRDRGLVILGFPANDFGAQEPGTNEEIEQFCTLKFNVTFPMFAKVTVKGPDRPPLFSWLVGGGGKPELSGEIGWNFEKFLINRHGKVIYRYKSTVDPLSDSFLKDIEAALAE